MKKMNLILIITILAMGAVTETAGQPARGNGNGNHDKNNRKEVKADDKKDNRGNRTVDFNKASDQKVRPTAEMKVLENANIRERSSSADKRQDARDSRPDDRSNYATDRDRRENGDDRWDKDKKGSWDNDKYRKEGYGNDKYWKERHDNDKHWKEYHYSHFYRKHYLPESFRSNRYYAYHPKYGHVLTKFPHNPVIFWSTARIPFYFDNGFFYRYHSGIGYVWVNDPYDLWFSELPYGAVRVRISGHTYYRLGNAYFVAGLRGFRLAVVPDRYYDYRPTIEISARF